MSGMPPTHRGEPELSVIIVSYNTRAMTLECLRTLSDELRGRRTAETIVVDNASSDGSAGAISAAHPEARWCW